MDSIQVHSATATLQPASAARPAVRLLRGSLGILALRFVGLGLSFGVGILAARTLGRAGFGAFENALAWVGLLSVPAGLGADRLLVRGTAAYRETRDWGRLRGLWIGAGVATLVAATAVTAAAVPVLALRPEWNGLLVGVAVVPLTAGLRFAVSALQGLGRVTWSQLTELVVVPLAFGAAVALAAAAAAASGGGIGPGSALACHAVAVGLAAGCAAVVAWRSRPPGLGAHAPVFAVRAWLREAAPLLLLGLLQVGNARLDVLVFGLVGDQAELGSYAAARRIAALVLAVLLATNAVLGPEIARRHARGDTDGLQRILTLAARASFAAAAVAGLALVATGDALTTCFGSDFGGTNAAAALRILVAGQLANVALGSVGLVLVMTGHGGAAVRGLLVGASVQLLAALALVPGFGAVGAATAATAGTVAWNLALTASVHSRLGLHPSILGAARR